MTVLGGADFPLARTGGGFSVPIERPRGADWLKRLTTKETLTGDAEISFDPRREARSSHLKNSAKSD
jgi:hypothetical protein